MAGGSTAMVAPSLLFAMVALTVLVISVAVDVRSLKSARVVNATATFCPEPLKPQPIIVVLLFTFGLSFRLLSNSFTTFRVRSVVASDGSWKEVRNQP